MSFFVCSSRFLPLQSSAALVPGGGGLADAALWQRPRLAEFRVSPSRQRPATAGQRVITAAAPPEVAVAGGRVMGSGRVSLLQRSPWTAGREHGTCPINPSKHGVPTKPSGACAAVQTAGGAALPSVFPEEAEAQRSSAQRAVQ